MRLFSKIIVLCIGVIMMLAAFCSDIQLKNTTTNSTIKMEEIMQVKNETLDVYGDDNYNVLAMPIIHSVDYDEAASELVSVDNSSASGESIRIGVGGCVKFGGINFNLPKTVMIFASGTGTSNIKIMLGGASGENIASLTFTSTAGVFDEHYANLNNNSIMGNRDIYVQNVGVNDVKLEYIVFSQYDGTENASQKDSRMQWWRNSRFGQFIHFGPYAYLGGVYNNQSASYSEWMMENLRISKEDYARDLSKKFAPSDFDGEQIAQIAKNAGQKYIVFTSKHHDGFSMYDTKIRNFKDYKLTTYNESYTNSKGKDVLKQLSEASKAANIKFGCYYTIMDWYTPHQNNYGEYASNKAAYIEEMKGQLRELIEDYGVEMLWFDGEWKDWWTRSDGEKLYRFLRTLNPSLIINNRVGKRHDEDGDFGTPEQEIPSMGMNMDWESCITMNGSWGYHATDTNYKNAEYSLSMLIETASKGGNLLLNIGPDAKGNVPTQSIQVLQKMGEWLDIYGQYIYKTNAGVFDTLPENVYCSSKDNEYYLFIKNWAQQLNIPMLNNDITSVKTVLGDVKYDKTIYGMHVLLPKSPPNEYFNAIAVAYTGVPQQIMPKTNLALGKSASASDVYGNNIAEYGANMAVDGDGETRWATSDSSNADVWLMVDFGQSTTFNRIVAKQCVTWGQRIDTYQIQIYNGEWQTIATGEGADILVSNFSDVTADKVRILIKRNGTNGPTLYEFEVFYDSFVNISEPLNGSVITQLPFDIKGKANTQSVELIFNNKSVSLLVVDGEWQLTNIKNLPSGIYTAKAVIKSDKGIEDVYYTTFEVQNNAFKQDDNSQNDNNDKNDLSAWIIGISVALGLTLVSSAAVFILLKKR